ncbi:hypothetical protein GCM10010413_44630 [Promicromonospora sukumoe]
MTTTAVTVTATGGCTEGWAGTLAHTGPAGPASGPRSGLGADRLSVRGALISLHIMRRVYADTPQTRRGAVNGALVAHPSRSGSRGDVKTLTLCFSAV